MRIFAATILDLNDFNLHWALKTKNMTLPGSDLSSLVDHDVTILVNKCKPRPVGKLVLLHGLDAIFHVERAGSLDLNHRTQVVGCCEIFLWPRRQIAPRNPSFRFSTSLRPTPSVTDILQTALARLTSSKLKRMLEAEQEVREYAGKHHPSLDLPQTYSSALSYARMVETIYRMESHTKTNERELRHTTSPARWEVGIDPHLQPHLHFWETSRFWHLFEKLQNRNLLEEQGVDGTQRPKHLQERNAHASDLWHLTYFWGLWISQMVTLRKRSENAFSSSFDELEFRDLATWIQQARYLGRHLAIRLVFTLSSGNLDVQIGRAKVWILHLGDQSNRLSEDPGLATDFELWPGNVGTMPSDLDVPEDPEDFKRCVRAALEEAHRTSRKAALLDVEQARLVTDPEHVREQWEQVERRAKDMREMEDLKIIFSLCSFLRALMPQERKWEEIELG